MTFYNEISSFYDKMIDFDKRLEGELINYKSFLKKHPVENVLDIGCGSGLHSIVLSKCGTKVIGIDLSEKMIKLANTNSARYNEKIDFYNIDIKNIRDKIKKDVDAVFCLGNTIPHIREEGELISIFKNFHNLLNPGGYFVLQLLNYDKIISNHDTVINKKVDKNNTYLRYYNFIDNNQIEFIIDKINNSTKKSFKKSIFLNPYCKDKLLNMLESSGFKNIKIYNEMDLSEFTENSFVLTIHSFK